MKIPIAIAHLEGDADDGEKHRDGQGPAAALEEDAAHVITERPVDIGQHGERGLEEPIRDGAEQAALESPVSPAGKEDHRR